MKKVFLVILIVLVSSIVYSQTIDSFLNYPNTLNIVLNSKTSQDNKLNQYAGSIQRGSVHFTVSVNVTTYNTEIAIKNITNPIILPQIVAYKYTLKDIHLIVRETANSDQKNISKYYIVSLQSKSCELIEDIGKYQQLVSFTPTSVMVNDNNVNMRNGPSVNDPKKAQVQRGDRLELTGKIANFSAIDSYSDYWYEVKHLNTKLWIFSKYITLPQSISIIYNDLPRKADNIQYFPSSNIIFEEQKENYESSMFNKGEYSLYFNSSIITVKKNKELVREIKTNNYFYTSKDTIYFLTQNESKSELAKYSISNNSISNVISLERIDRDQTSFVITSDDKYVLYYGHYYYIDSNNNDFNTNGILVVDMKESSIKSFYPDFTDFGVINNNYYYIFNSERLQIYNSKRELIIDQKINNQGNLFSSMQSAKYCNSIILFSSLDENIYIYEFKDNKFSKIRDFAKSRFLGYIDYLGTDYYMVYDKIKSTVDFYTMDNQLNMSMAFPVLSNTIVLKKITFNNEKFYLYIGYEK